MTSEGRLRAYAELVGRWAPRIDLISPRDVARFRARHIEDSLRLLPFVDALPEGAAVDVGSGAGLPGVPLAIRGRPRPWRLIEPRAKRAAFLEEVVRELDLEAEVVPRSAQEAARDPGLRGAHVVATARALAPPSAAFRLVLPLVAPEGSAFVVTGSRSAIPRHAAFVAPGIVRMTPMLLPPGKTW